MILQKQEVNVNGKYLIILYNIFLIFKNTNEFLINNDL